MESGRWRFFHRKEHAKNKEQSGTTGVSGVKARSQSADRVLDERVSNGKVKCSSTVDDIYGFTNEWTSKMPPTGRRSDSVSATKTSCMSRTKSHSSVYCPEKTEENVNTISQLTRASRSNSKSNMTNFNSDKSSQESSSTGSGVIKWLRNSFRRSRSRSNSRNKDKTGKESEDSGFHDSMNSNSATKHAKEKLKSSAVPNSPSKNASKNVSPIYQNNVKKKVELFETKTTDENIPSKSLQPQVDKNLSAYIENKAQGNKSGQYMSAHQAALSGSNALQPGARNQEPGGSSSHSGDVGDNVRQATVGVDGEVLHTGNMRSASEAGGKEKSLQHGVNDEGGVKRKADGMLVTTGGGKLDGHSGREGMVTGKDPGHGDPWVPAAGRARGGVSGVSSKSSASAVSRLYPNGNIRPNSIATANPSSPGRKTLSPPPHLSILTDLGPGSSTYKTGQLSPSRTSFTLIQSSPGHNRQNEAGIYGPDSDPTRGRTLTRRNASLLRIKKSPSPPGSDKQAPQQPGTPTKQAPFGLRRGSPDRVPVSRIPSVSSRRVDASIGSTLHSQASQQHIVHAQVHPHVSTGQHSHHNHTGSNNAHYNTTKLPSDSHHNKYTTNRTTIQNGTSGGVRSYRNPSQSPSRTAEVLEQFNKTDSDYRNQLKNCDRKYYGSVTGSLQNLRGASPRFRDHRDYPSHRNITNEHSSDDEDAPPRPPLPLETHFLDSNSRPSSICSSSTYSETMVSCKEAIQKATTVITRTKSPTKTHNNPNDISDKIKAYEQLNQNGSPSSDRSSGQSSMQSGERSISSELSRDRSSGLSSEHSSGLSKDRSSGYSREQSGSGLASEQSRSRSVSISDTDASSLRAAARSIISKIENVGNHGSYFHLVSENQTPGKSMAESGQSVATGNSGAAGQSEKTIGSNESSIWTESDLEHVPPKVMSLPRQEQECLAENYNHGPHGKLYRNNWQKLQDGANHLLSHPDSKTGRHVAGQNLARNPRRSASLSSELFTSSMTDTSTLDWNSAQDVEDSIESVPDGQGKQQSGVKPVALSPVQFPPNTGHVNAVLANSTPFQPKGRVSRSHSTTPTSKHSKQSGSRNENQRLDFDTETTVSSVYPECIDDIDPLTESKLMDSTLKTKDLNTSTGSNDTSRRGHYIKHKPSQHNIQSLAEKYKAKKVLESGGFNSHPETGPLWRSQSQPNVQEESVSIRQQLRRVPSDSLKLRRVPSESSISSDDWSSTSSLDGGHLGNVVEARIRKTRQTYRVQGQNYSNRRSRSQGNLAQRSKPRSMSRSQSRDRCLDGIIQPEKDYILERWWATLGDIPATVAKDCELHNHRTTRKNKADRQKNGK